MIKKTLALLLPIVYCLLPVVNALAASGCTYPTTLDTFTNVSPSDDLTATNYNTLQCAIEKTEAELGANPKGSYGSVTARLNDAVYTARAVNTGTGLSGGGNLSADRTISIDSTVATLSGSQTLSNKTLDNTTIATIKDGNLTVVDDADVTKAAKFQASGITTATTRTYTLPNADGTLTLQSRAVNTGTGLSGGGDLSADRTLSIDATVATLTGSQTLSNKTLDNSNIFTIRDDRLTLQDNLDTTKQAALQLSSISTATTRTYTLPNASGTVVLESGSVSNTGVVLDSTSGLQTTSGLSLDRSCTTGQILKKQSGGWACDSDVSTAGVTLGSWGSRGNASKNNATTPNTKIDLTAASVILRNSANETLVVHNPSTITNDTSLDNTTTNGRDQSGAFSNSTWVHFYWVHDGTTLKSRSSTAAPPAGPTLPSPETHWAYCCAFRKDGSGNFLKMRYGGNVGMYEEHRNVLNGGTAGTETAVDVSTYVPPNAISYGLYGHMLADPQSVAGQDQGTFRLVSGVNYSIWLIYGNTSVSVQYSSKIDLPNISQSYMYLVNRASSGGGVATTHNVTNFTVPNGG